MEESAKDKEIGISRPFIKRKRGKYYVFKRYIEFNVC